MNSLEWRVKNLEDRILSPSVRTETSLIDQLDAIAKYVPSESSYEKYEKFLTAYNQFKQILDSDINSTHAGESQMVDLVLAYEDDLVRHLKDIEGMASKANSVLDAEKWPDVAKFQDRIDKLETITKGQLSQSRQLDERTDRLIGIYNDIIVAFKRNIATWNENLEAHEMNERSHYDDDADG